MMSHNEAIESVVGTEDALKKRVAELEAERDALQRQAAAMREQIKHGIRALEDWGPSPTDAFTIQDMLKSMKPAAGRDFVPRAVADKLAAALERLQVNVSVGIPNGVRIPAPACRISHSLFDAATAALAEYRKATQ